jgi:hypothetical protein
MTWKFRMCRTQTVIVVMLALILSGCGAGSAGTNATTSAGDSNTAGGSVQSPGGPDTSVSGQPGAAPGKATGAVVEGVITDAAGKPLVGAVVMPKSVDTPPKAVPEMAVFTNEQGRYRWTLAPGKYVLSVSHNGVVTESEPITVTESQPATLDVSIK